MFKKTIHDNIKAFVVLAIIYSIFCNTPIILFKAKYYGLTALSVAEIVKELVYVTFSVFISLYGLSFNKKVLYIGVTILFISGSVSSYYLYFLGIQPTQQVILGSLLSSWRDVTEIISIKVVMWTMIVTSIPLLMIYATPLITQHKALKIALLCILGYIIPKPQFKVLTTYFPWQYLYNTYLAAQELMHKTEKIDISKNYTFIDNSAKDINIVLILGESARFDHFGINGYYRNTTPEISSIPNLFSFETIASSSITYLSIPRILTRATDPITASKETTALSVFTKLGFNTAWFGTQSLLKFFGNTKTFYDEVKFLLLPGGSILYQMNDIDEKLLSYIDTFLQQPGKKMLVLHTSGSHWDYAMRYPLNFQKFTPVCKTPKWTKRDQSSCSIAELVNMYDNTILYTDYVVSRIIERFKHLNTFLIYTSDHGESLGEKGILGHGSSNAPEQLLVPTLVWMSDIFISQFPEMHKAIQTHMHRSIITHDYIFPSILDCANIESDIIDISLSLCRTK